MTRHLTSSPRFYETAVKEHDKQLQLFSLRQDLRKLLLTQAVEQLDLAPRTVHRHHELGRQLREPVPSKVEECCQKS